jgi:hypothetical protein
MKSKSVGKSKEAKTPSGNENAQTQTLKKAKL